MEITTGNVETVTIKLMYSLNKKNRVCIKYLVQNKFYCAFPNLFLTIQTIVEREPGTTYAIFKFIILLYKS
jgi:hypothetical protein